MLRCPCLRDYLGEPWTLDDDGHLDCLTERRNDTSCLSIGIDHRRERLDRNGLCFWRTHSSSFVGRIEAELERALLLPSVVEGGHLRGVRGLMHESETFCTELRGMLARLETTHHERMPFHNLDTCTCSDQMRNLLFEVEWAPLPD